MMLQNVFPGLWLVGLTPEAYRIVDAAPNKVLSLDQKFHFNLQLF